MPRIHHVSLIRVSRTRNMTLHRSIDPTLVCMGTNVLSLRIDRDLLERLRRHAAKRGMSVQDYVLQTLVRDDFDERFRAAVEETEKFYGAARDPRAIPRATGSPKIRDGSAQISPGPRTGTGTSSRTR
jgi:hypothetical protein